MDESLTVTITDPSETFSGTLLLVDVTDDKAPFTQRPIGELSLIEGDALQPASKHTPCCPFDDFPRAGPADDQRFCAFGAPYESARALCDVQPVRYARPKRRIGNDNGKAPP